MIIRKILNFNSKLVETIPYNKVLSIFLIVILFSGCAIYYTPNNKVSAKKKKSTVVRELEDERTVNSNTYLMSDGSKKKEIFFENIRYKDGGKLKEYNASLDTISNNDKKLLNKKIEKKANDYLLVNKSGDCKQFFPTKLNDSTGVVMNENKYSIEIAPIVNEDEFNIEHDKNKIKYKSAADDIIYEYASNNHSVKENIILNKNNKNKDFDFVLDTKNIKVSKKDNDSGIELLDDKTEKSIAYIEPAYLIDNNENIDYENIVMTIQSGDDFIKKQMSDNQTIIDEKETSESSDDNPKSIEQDDLETYKDKTILTISIKEKYFKNKKIKYPITIDPTITWTDSDLYSASLWSYGPSKEVNGEVLKVSNKYSRSGPFSGSTYIGILDTRYIDTLNSAIQNNAIKKTEIINASLNFYEADIPSYVYPAGDIEITPITQYWARASLSWTRRPSVASEPIATEAMTGTDGDYHSVNITDWMQDVVDGEADNEGLEITCPDEYSSAYMYSPVGRSEYDQNNNSQDPYKMNISVTYKDTNAYDGTVGLSGEYDKTDKKIDLTIEDDYSSTANLNVSAYKIYARKDNASSFERIIQGTNITDDIEIDTADIESLVDLRAYVVYSDATAKVSNILTYEKVEVESVEEETTVEETTEEPTTIQETTTSASNNSHTFGQITKDTDGDGLEDGYEIWDFETLWNTETNNSTPDNREYDVDTDNDGLPDGYEVMYQGTNPSEADNFNIDSDGDGWSDLYEYNNNTDPHLYDSDFDNVRDAGDSNPRKTNDHTYQSVGNSTVVYKGLYDVEVSETELLIEYTSIKNLYSGLTKQMYCDYNSSSLNKKMKYFYDCNGNNTAIVEMYDSTDPNGTQTIVITYTYDDSNNNTFICDQSTKYTMDYSDGGNINSFSVGNLEILSNTSSNIVDNEEDIDELEVGDVIKQDSRTETYGNNSNSSSQKVKTVTTTYKTDEDSQTAMRVETYYGNDNNPSFRTNLNENSKILSFYDYRDSQNNPIVYTYTYSGDTQTVSRNDNFTKSLTETDDSNNNKHTKSVSYSFKDVANQTTNYTETEESPIDVGEDDTITVNKTLFNGDKYVDNDVQSAGYTTSNNQITELKSTNNNNATIQKTYVNLNSVTHTTYTNKDNNDITESLYYTYDLAGNITKIQKGSNTLSEYEYDAHGRLILEKDYSSSYLYEYVYNTTGNLQSRLRYNMSSSGVKISQTEYAIYYQYNNSNWPDQMTGYGELNNGVIENTITYDGAGNPLSYRDGMTLEWTRGRTIDKFTDSNNDETEYKYNEDGLRTYKDNDNERVIYDWDGNTLVRELVYKKSTQKYYDLWYYYDNESNPIGFEYNYLNDSNQKEKVVVYYKKDLQGNIIGLLDDEGNQIVSYSYYDGWGRESGAAVVVGNELTASLNHIKYRGYYKDEESGFYYLQSRYYDGVTGRFLNGDSIYCLDAGETAFKYNLYTYCESNPVKFLDSNGFASYTNSIKGNKVTSKIYFIFSTLKYHWCFNAGIIKMDFSKNSYGSLVARLNIDVLARAMYSAFKKKYGFCIHRTISGIGTETLLHYAAYKLHFMRSHTKIVDIGGTISYRNKSKKWGYDSNAWFFETANAARVVNRILNGGIWGVKRNIANMKEYFK